MRKIIAIALTAAMLLSCAAANAQAAGRITNIAKSLEDESQIHILYNDKIVQYDDVKPVNTEDRVMIPFRAALENMGASVDYDDAQRMVTAKKGDITIKFTLMDDTIYIDKNGEQSTITMDVPMIIVNDRTLVPIRFMSNALDMQVGWDGDSQTVIIMDYDDYFDDFASIAPNMNKMTNVKNSQYNKEYTEFNFAFNAFDDNTKVDFSISGDADSTYADDTVGSDMNLNVALSINGTDCEIKDADLNFVMKDGQMYAKTNLFGKIADITENKVLKVGLGVVDENKWYKLDMYKLIDAMSVPAETKDILKTSLTISSLTSETDATKTLLQSMVNEDDSDATLDTALALAVQFDMYEQFDKYFSVTTKDNGEYSISVNITENDFADIMRNVMGDTADENLIQEILGALKINIAAVSEGNDAKAESNAKVVMDFVVDDGTSFGLSVEITDKAEKDDSVQAVQIPEDCTDITSLLIDSVK